MSVPRLPERRRETMPEDLEWMLKTTASGSPYIAVNSVLSDEEAREAERDAIRAYNRDQRRRRGILALPLFPVDKGRHAARDRSAASTAVGAGAVAVVLVGALVLASVMPPHQHHSSNRPIAQPPAPRPTVSAEPPTHHRRPHPPVTPPPERPGTLPSAEPSHQTLPVADRAPVSHPAKRKPRPPKPRHPPTRPPASPPPATTLGCGIHLEVPRLIRLRVELGDGTRRRGVLCLRSP
jgi:hypothetical protein